MGDDQKIAGEVIALERAALDRWGKGDPDGYLGINAADVSYFDPFLERRVDGLPSLTDWYAQVRGKLKSFVTRSSILASK